MNLELCQKQIKLKRPVLRSPIRILHLSDFHASRLVPFRLIEKAIAMGLASRPDLICVTGDFVTVDNPVNEPRYKEVLRPLASAAPAFASFGNHDGGLWTASKGSQKDCSRIERIVSESGIRPLRNASETVAIRGQRLRLCGLGDLWSWDAKPAQAFPPEAPDLCTIVMAHNPDTKTVIRRLTWDLMLSGHTHGGQVILPVIGMAFVPVADTRFIAGVYEWEGRHIHITRGVGNIKGIRLNCRPEVSVLMVS